MPPLPRELWQSWQLRPNSSPPWRSRSSPADTGPLSGAAATWVVGVAAPGAGAGPKASARPGSAAANSAAAIVRWKVVEERIV
ncbi:hypothetical protein [Methylibium sp.]|uniref:hypothetical protein n=1 Tax=Methylibium sp. TaxID=2067992 RepID=UPI003341A1F2